MNGTMEAISYIVMGIGINTGSTQDELPEFIKDVATSFAMEGVEVDRRQALNIILQEMEMQYNKVLAEGFDSTLAEWKEFSITFGAGRRSTCSGQYV